mmetsp:Transcript_5463/g.14504  ORF Transcript_5463/g.14504 Transcript_5463/m.14504 type:complete len:192 (-) Transcript_5463:185-760(-)
MRLQRIDEVPVGEDCFPLVAVKAAVVTLGLAVLLGLWHDEVAALAPGPTRSRAVAFYCSGGPEPSQLLHALAEVGFEAEALHYSDAEADRLTEELTGPGARGRPAGYARQGVDEGGCNTARFEDLLRSLEAIGVPQLGQQEEHAAEQWEAAGLAGNGTRSTDLVGERALGDAKLAGAVSGRFPSASLKMAK